MALKWYVVHTYSGYENKVQQNLLKQIEVKGMGDRIKDVLIPTEEQVEIRRGKRRTVEKKIFPGYILIHMELTDETWYMVRNTPGVTGFIGDGTKPTPLPENEVASLLKRMGLATPKVTVTWKENDGVRVLSGPFSGFTGVIRKLDENKEKVTVMLSIFGRETPVELEFDKVEQI
jgi:transcription termination/antitermination protein NusG